MRPSAPKTMVNVTVNQGVVTLTGTVDNDTARSQAEQTVRTVSGVVAINNNLAVRPPLGFSSDQTLKNTVDSNLQSQGVSGVTATVSNGEITLRGAVTREQLQAALKAAGVKTASTTEVISYAKLA